MHGVHLGRNRALFFAPRARLQEERPLIDLEFEVVKEALSRLPIVCCAWISLEIPSDEFKRLLFLLLLHEIWALLYCVRKGTLQLLWALSTVFLKQNSLWLIIFENISIGFLRKEGWVGRVWRKQCSCVACWLKGELWGSRCECRRPQQLLSSEGGVKRKLMEGPKLMARLWSPFSDQFWCLWVCLKVLLPDKCKLFLWAVESECLGIFWF